MQSTSCKVLCAREAVLYSCEGCNLWKIYLKLVDLVTRLVTRYKENRLGKSVLSGSISGSERLTGA